MVDIEGEVLINNTQITNPGLHKVSSPKIAIDNANRLHSVWFDKAGYEKIMYTALDPFSAVIHNGVGRQVTPNLTLIDIIVVNQVVNESNLDLAVDSQGNVHGVWQDSFDGWKLNFDQTNICYQLLKPNYSHNDTEILIDSTVLSTEPLSSNHDCIG